MNKQRTPWDIGQTVADAWLGQPAQRDFIEDSKDAVEDRDELAQHIAEAVAADRAAAEQRGRVAGLLKAARTMCPECADGCPAIRSGQGRWCHPVAGTTTHCHAAAIHALIAEEARSE